MFTKIAARILATVLPLVMAFNGLTFSVPFLGGKTEISYDFSNSEAGSAAGTVTVSSSVNGDYEIYWGTDAEEKLSVEVNGNKAYYSELCEMTVSSGSASAEIYEFTAIPEGAQTVLAFRNRVLMASTDIPDEKLADNGGKTYSFGALSDLHFNRYNFSLSGDDAQLTFPNALTFLSAFDISLVGMSGDLSTNGERSAFEKFNSIASRYDFPVYTCTGNHDVSSYYELKNWQELINTGVYGENKRAGVVEVADNGMDFVYAPSEAKGDVFIFFSQYRWDYNKPTSRLVTDEQLDWLSAQLEKYKNETVFLFFHTFLANADGDPDMGEGNLKNNVGNSYDLVFTPGTADEARFRELMKEYKNVVFFNGHSHWAYDMQKFNPQMNITDYNGEYATMVHISSVSSPRRTTANSLATTEHAMRSSEGMLVTVYPEKIVFTACDFLSGELLAYATYVIEK